MVICWCTRIASSSRSEHICVKCKCLHNADPRPLPHLDPPYTVKYYQFDTWYASLSSLEQIRVCAFSRSALMCKASGWAARIQYTISVQRRLGLQEQSISLSIPLSIPFFFSFFTSSKTHLKRTPPLLKNLKVTSLNWIPSKSIDIKQNRNHQFWKAGSRQCLENEL